MYVSIEMVSLESKVRVYHLIARLPMKQKKEERES